MPRPQVARRCLALTSADGPRSGAFDLILTPEGEHVRLMESRGPR